MYRSHVPFGNRALGGVVAALLFLALAVGCPQAGARPHSVRRHVTQLHFAAGQRRITVTGAFNPRRHSHTYAIHGRAGQRLRIRLTDLPFPRDSPDNGLVTSYHITFPSGKQFGLKGYDPFTGRLTETGRYLITVDVNMMASNGTRGRYRLTLRR